MKRRLSSVFLFATVVLLSACPSPSGGLGPASPLVPSTFDAAPDAGTGSGTTGGGTEEKVEGPPPPGDVAEATPSWTASSAGSVGCLAAEILVPVSLKDRSFLQPGNMGVTVEVRNVETGEREPLADHDLATNLLFRDPSGNFIEEGGDASYKSLEIGVRIFSSYVPRTIVGVKAPSGPTCEEIWEGLLQDRFVLAFSYRRGKTVYQGSLGEDVSVLPPGQPPLRLDPVVLAAVRD